MSGLVGLWRLVSAKREYADLSDAPHEDIYGPEPMGYLLLAPGGRMMAFLSRKKREGDVPALYGSMMAYAGSYRVDGNRWITDVDMSWFPAWLGTAQERFYRVEGDDLYVESAVVEHPANPGRTMRGILQWKREDRLV